MGVVPVFTREEELGYFGQSSRYPWDGVRLVTGRVNQVTGEVVPIDPPLALPGDLAEWWADSWAETDWICYKIEVAVAAAKAGAR
jgi:hypothetical protein